MKKIYIASAVLALTLLLGSPRVYGFGGCEEDCAKCHSLEQKEAEQILLQMKATDTKVTGIKMSPVRGLWEVSTDKGGRRDILYVGFSKKQVMQGTITDLDAANGSGQQKAPENKPAESKKPADARYIETAKIPLGDALVLGDSNAVQKVIVFTDPDCPYCAMIHSELKKVVVEKSDIVFYLKLMPLTKMHPDAYWKAKSIACSRSMLLLEENFEKKPIPRPSCESPVIDENIKLGVEIGITGTPTLIMPDGFVVLGGGNARVIRDLVSSHQKKGS